MNYEHLTGNVSREGEPRFTFIALGTLDYSIHGFQLAKDHDEHIFS